MEHPLADHVNLGTGPGHLLPTRAAFDGQGRAARGAGPAHLARSLERARTRRTVARPGPGPGLAARSVSGPARHPGRSGSRQLQSVGLRAGPGLAGPLRSLPAADADPRVAAPGSQLDHPPPGLHVLASTTAGLAYPLPR